MSTPCRHLILPLSFQRSVLLCNLWICISFHGWLTLCYCHFSYLTNLGLVKILKIVRIPISLHYVHRLWNIGVKTNVYITELPCFFLDIPYSWWFIVCLAVLSVELGVYCTLAYSQGTQFSWLNFFCIRVTIATLSSNMS